MLAAVISKEPWLGQVRILPEWMMMSLSTEMLGTVRVVSVKVRSPGTEMLGAVRVVPVKVRSPGTEKVPSVKVRVLPWMVGSPVVVMLPVMVNLELLMVRLSMV